NGFSGECARSSQDILYNTAPLIAHLTDWYTPTVEKIAHYEIQSEIGRGGFGQVYRAYDPRVRRFVAIKVLNCSDPQMLSRFHLEATAAGNLNHPNIVTIHEYVEHNGQPYLVMEYLEGRDLQRTMEAGPQLDLLQLADVMSDVADGLHCAH